MPRYDLAWVRMGEVRLLKLTAGPFRVALPITSIRQILELGGKNTSATTDPRALGVVAVPLAEVLGATKNPGHPALLLVDAHGGPNVIEACSLDGFLETPEVKALPGTVVTRWPGLVRGTVRTQAGLWLVLEPSVLVGLIEAWQSDAPAQRDIP